MTTNKPALPEPVARIASLTNHQGGKWYALEPLTSKSLQIGTKVCTVDQVRAAIEAAVAEVNALNGALTDKCNSYIIANARLAEQVAEARAEIEALKSDIADALTTIAVYEAEARAVPVVTDNMVSRFLCWPLPRDFYPDCGISFDGRKDDEWNKNKTWPTGTNLLTAIQARQMLAHVLAVTPSPAEQPKPDEFCWLVELFEGDGTGNSAGWYHTGFVDIGGHSRTTKNPHEARRYTTRAQAEQVAAKLGHTLTGTWRAVEHGFATAEQPKLCGCKDRPASECPGEWEPGCDLGANEKFVKVAEQPKPVDEAACRAQCDYCGHDWPCAKQRADEQPKPAAVSKVAAIEMSPEFTDTARDALLWVLWHHQGGGSPIGQPIRFALGMGAHDRLSAHQIERAKRWAALTKSETADFRREARGFPSYAGTPSEDARWQPIETADPNAHALLYAPPEALFVDPAGRRGQFFVAAPRNWTWATYWMPLPAAPVAALAAQEQKNG